MPTDPWEPSPQSSQSNPTALELVRMAGLTTQKRLGQHHLISQGIIEKITSLIPKGSSIIEIGPGAGILSFPLAQIAKKLTLVEKDVRLETHLKKLFANFSNVKLLIGDCLNINFKQHAHTGQTYIVSNLPYNISVQVLTRLIGERFYSSQWILMFQKEVANRLLSKTREKTYGSLSIFVQNTCEIQKICDVSPGSFLPPPEIKSTILFFKPKKIKDLKILQSMEKITIHCFQRRRKMLKKSLGLWLSPSEIEEVLENIASSSARPEELSPVQWWELSGRIYRRISRYSILTFC